MVVVSTQTSKSNELITISNRCSATTGDQWCTNPFIVCVLKLSTQSVVDFVVRRLVRCRGSSPRSKFAAVTMTRAVATSRRMKDSIRWTQDASGNGGRSIPSVTLLVWPTINVTRWNNVHHRNTSNSSAAFCISTTPHLGRQTQKPQRVSALRPSGQLKCSIETTATTMRSNNIPFFMVNDRDEVHSQIWPLSVSSTMKQRHLCNS